MTLPVSPPVKPMLAKVSEDIPSGDEWLYEPKWDGFRTIVYKDGDEIWLRSRTDRPLDRYFPECVELLRSALPRVCVLDGEIILPSPEGLAFDALQLRLHPAASRVNKLAAEIPTSFVAFDILGLAKDDLRERPLAERLDVLADVLGKTRPKVARDPATSPGGNFYLTPCTDDPKLAAEWFDDLEKVGCDGVIAKNTTLPYSEGKRVMLKIKHKRTADCVVAGYRQHKHGGVGSLLLGLYDDGTLRYVGHTASFNAAQRKELEAMLEPYVADESAFGWPGEEEWDGGPGGESRWNAGKDQSWVSLRPELVCEVSYDFVQSGYRFRHAATFRAWREDKTPDECVFDQVRD